MSSLTHTPGETTGVATTLEASLGALELEIYLSLDGIEEAAVVAAAQAAELHDQFAQARAELIGSDAISRGGNLDEALMLQRAVAQRARDRADTAIEARAACQLASTYNRLGLRSESQDAAETGVRLLGERCPPSWHAEHLMVLALFTSDERVGTVDFALFDESLRRARRLAEPTLLMAVLNNYAWTASQSAGRPRRAAQLVDEMEALLADGTFTASAAWLDTVGWIRFAQGEVERAESIFEHALSCAGTVEAADRAELLAHLAAIRRRQGRVDDAAALLETARAIGLARKTPEVAVNALRELAHIDAERGDHRRAYRRLARYIDEQRAAERVDSERRATILQSIYGIELERDQRRYYQQLASRDALTGLYNRRHVEDRLPRLLEAGCVAVAIVDVDHFKQINDRHSHDAGDAVLRQLGVMLAEHAAAMSPHAFAARLGGEEFLLVAPELAPENALSSLEALRRSIERHDWSSIAAGAHPTISAGLVVSRAPGADSSTLMAAADALLYAAKRAGRNRVVSAPDADG